MRETKDGRLALLVYKAPDRLVACCGDAQPSTLKPTQAGVR
ncbi:SAV_915 family protein [Cellulomonas bogoriensis]